MCHLYLTVGVVVSLVQSHLMKLALALALCQLLSEWLLRMADKHLASFQFLKVVMG